MRGSASGVFNRALQLAGDPRWWPRDLSLERRKRLWRTSQHAEGAWPPADVTVRLRGLTNAQFAEAKFWYLGVTYLYIGAALLAALAFGSTLFQDENDLAKELNLQENLLLAAVACQVLAAITRLRAIRLHSIAVEADWRELIMESMGPSESEKEEAMVMEGLFADGARARAGALTNYYSSGQPAGAKRLIANLRETAFFTEDLYKTAYTRGWYFAVAVIIVPLIPLLGSMILKEKPSTSVFVLALTSVLPLWDIMFRLRGWRSAAETLARVRGGLRTATELRDALPFLTDAAAATATAPPIPRVVYNRKAGPLQERWRQISGQGLPDPDPDDDPSPLDERLK
ncbi:MAG TPA: hypothetical protein VHF90_01435 [Thermoleophilaceae bacterium]|nr:hypothetical protein [Thermoleophilaceae bacterium]